MLNSPNLPKPIAHYWSSRSNPMPASTEQWLERLPLGQKILLATALLKQCEPAFRHIPTLAIAPVENQPDDVA